MLGIVRDHCRFVVTQEVKSPLRVFVGTKRDKVGQGRSDVGTLIVRAVMGHDSIPSFSSELLRGQTRVWYP